MKPINLLIIGGLIGNFFFGEIGAYAMIKYSLSEEFRFPESFLGNEINLILGLLDTSRQVGTLLGTIWVLIFSIKKLKRRFFMYTVAKCILMVFLTLGGKFSTFT